jgi:hypothetical protein
VERFDANCLSTAVTKVLDFSDIMAEEIAMTDIGKLAETAQICDLLLQVQGLNNRYITISVHSWNWS